MNVHGRLAALARDFPSWQVQRINLRPTYVAVLQRGTFTHVIAAHDLDDLRTKMGKAAPS